MKTYTQWTGIDPKHRGASVAMGNFDGVHLGHQAVIDAARRTGAPLGIVTFEPHPREVFAPDAPPFRLMNAAARAERFQKLGIDVLIELPFDAALAGLTAEAFAREIIAEGLGLAHVVTGADFQFGKGRDGGADDLARFGAQMGFGATAVPLMDLDGQRISSTAIRQALTDGQPGQAAQMLGHWHRIVGPVEHGEKRGRELGYPTANLSIAHLHLPKFGVYATTVDVLTGPQAGQYQGATSIGTRPMFGENRPNCETYLFDFKGDLYGQMLSVGLVEFLRPELTFDSVDALTTQMQADCDQARARLADV